MIDLLQLRNVISCTWFIKSIKAIKKKKSMDQNQSVL